MKEIIYVQVGRLSNYTGTHFWNTQESYLSSSEHEDFVDSSASFCESVDEKVSSIRLSFSFQPVQFTLFQGRSTLCPRVLIVDNKSNL